MRKIIIIMLLMPFIGTTQYNFKTVDGKLYYHNIFELPDLDSAEIADLVLTKFKSNNFSQKDYIVDYKKAGGNYMSTSPVISNSLHFFDVTIQIKEGRYRVITTNHTYRMNTKFSESVWGIAENDNNKESLESFFLNKKGDFRTNKNVINSAKLLSKSLDDFFGSIESHGEVMANDDW